MIKVLTNEEMRELDLIASKGYAIPSIILMENAAIEVYNSIVKHYGTVENKNIFIFAGKGNNAGDGFALARKLYNNMANVFVFCVYDPKELSGDALINFNILLAICNDKLKTNNLDIVHLNNVERVFGYPDPDLIIDAIFGIGVKGEIQGLAKEVIQYCNKSNTPTIAIDIPSGLNGNIGEKCNVAINADMTVTMALPKRGLLINEGPRLTGKLEIADISIPLQHLFNNSSRTFLLQDEDVKIRMPRRNYDSHKYTTGKVFVLAGSVGLTGAAALASEAALYSGVGAVILGIPESLNPIMEKKLTEVMTTPLPETPEKTISIKALSTIRQYIDWSDVTLIGPGLSQNEETKAVIKEILLQSSKPLVIDADGLNNLQTDIDLIKNYKGEIILTPHYGELSRFTAQPTSEIALNRISIARDFAKEKNITLILKKELNVTMILKGAPTVISDKNGNVYINSTGNSGMATAGAGDVLAGLTPGFFAQLNNPINASILSVFLHGLAGDIAKEEKTIYSLTATDILKNIHTAIKRFVINS
jgi:NAD(P)H-hydrate epimerase